MTKPIAAYSWTEDRVQVRHLAAIVREARDQLSSLPFHHHAATVPAPSPSPFPSLLDLPGLTESDIHGIKELRSPLSD
jgi:hypothetical protein